MLLIGLFFFFCCFFINIRPGSCAHIFLVFFDVYDTYFMIALCHFPHVATVFLLIAHSGEHRALFLLLINCALGLPPMLAVVCLDCTVSS